MATGWGRRIFTSDAPWRRAAPGRSESLTTGRLVRGAAKIFDKIRRAGSHRHTINYNCEVRLMAKRRKKAKSSGKRPAKVSRTTIRIGRANPHGELANNFVHVFVDDQNLFWGIVNNKYGPDFRIDFGRLLLEGARDSKGQTRGVASAYIAGVIPDDDTFWKVAENRGFKVRRGYLGAGNRSKQDDAYLITDMTRTLYKNPGPSTIVLVAGDADYVPPLEAALEEGWRTEIAFIDRGVSVALERYMHEFREISPYVIEHLPQ